MNRFGCVHLVIFISNILLGRFDYIDSLLKFCFGKFGLIDLVWYIWFSPEERKFGSEDLAWYIGSGKLGLVAS